MSKTRIKQTLATITTRAEAESVLNELAQVVNTRRKIITDRDAEVLKINEVCTLPIAQCDALINEHTDTLRAWAEANPAEFPKGRKSIDLQAGIIGFRTGTPKLSLLSRAWSWDKVLTTIKSIKDLAAMFIRTKEEVDKEAILGVYSDIKGTPVAQDELRRIGLKITQDETFFVEPDLTKFEPRQTQEAA